METKKRIKTRLLALLLRLGAAVVLVAAAPGFGLSSVAAMPDYLAQGSANVAPAAAMLTAVDPLAWEMFGDVMPARPFLYSVDQNGITITRFNDNKVVGTWPWPDDVWIELPDGSITDIPKPTVDGWEPVGITVSYPTETEVANRVKEIPDLTPPWTFVYVVMAHSGYEWQSSPDSGLLESPNVRDHLVPSTNPDNESALLLQIDVSDPSFSASRDSAAPVEPHIAGAILGHGAVKPVYDRKTGNVYVGNQPSGSLAAGLTSFVSIVHRIPPTVTAEEREIPGIGKPVIRCGPQHPETGIPVGRPQAYACYDPSGYHPINDNEHVGAYGALEDRDGDGTLDEQYVWEFRNLAGEETTGPLGTWLTAHTDLVTGEPDGILYGTPPVTGDFHIEARVHNLDDEWGVFSDWHPIHLLVNPTAEYLPIKAEFAVGVPVSYQIEGTGICALSGAPAWVDIKPVPGGCAIMGRAPISGEHYEFTMPNFRETAYPDIPIVFSGNVVGAYGFDPLPEGAGIAGMAWHQVEKVADPSTETAVLTGEFIGVDPATGQLYRVLQAPGQPQPPNERPAETAITIDTVSLEGAVLSGSGFGDVAVEADRDIYVAADGGVIKVSGGTASLIPIGGLQGASLSLDSDLRTAIIGVEPGQVDHGALWVAGADSATVIDTGLGQVAQTFPVSGASSVSVDFPSQYAYVANGSSDVATFGPGPRPQMAPRIWSVEEVNWNRGYPGEMVLMATGDPVPTLELMGTLPDGLTYVDNGDGTATVSGTPTDAAGGDGYAFTLTATNSEGLYAQAVGMTVYTTSQIISDPAATFYLGSASSFTVEATSATLPILYTWDELLMPPGVQLVDNENGTASLIGTPTAAGSYTFTIGAFTGFPVDGQQSFTLTVVEGTSAPVITSGDTATWEVIGAPYSPDQFTVTSIGSPTPVLSISTETGQTGLPPGVTFIDNGDSTATFGADCQISWPGMAPECIGVLPDAAEGTWTFTIRATNDGGATYATQPFTLIVETATSIMTPPPTAPANLAFAYTPGAPMPPSQIFTVRTLGDTIPYAAVTTTSWLDVTPKNGHVGLDQGDLNVLVDPTGLLPGTYTGTVLVTSAGTDGPFATALVTLTVVDVAAPGELGIFPGTLSFQYKVNDPLPQPQPILVMSGGIPLDYTVSTGGAKWLSVTTAGTAPDIINISVDPKVGVGMHIANLTLSSEGGPLGPQTQTIPVTLVKTAGDRNLIQVMFSVGSGPEGMAINLNTHNLFITSSSGGAEAAEAAGGGAEAELPGPPEPSLVFQINPADKTLVKQYIVHSEGEYIGVNSKTGRAYHASLGAGEVAVIDTTTQTVAAFIPLILDDVVYQPYQIAIDEAQNFIYVGAKSPEPEPNALNVFPYGCKAIRELPSDEAAAGQEELDCWTPGAVFVIDGNTNTVVGSFFAGDDPEGVVFAKATGKVYASNEDDGTVTVAKGAVRNKAGGITNAYVIGTIIAGKLTAGQWQPTCDANNYCGQRGQGTNLSLWVNPAKPAWKSACEGIDDEAEEADKIAADPAGNVYVIDDRYRVAKIDGKTSNVVNVLAIPGYDCERTIPDGSTEVLRNTANNIAYMALGQGKLYVTSEQNTITLIDPRYMTIKATLTIPKAAELDAITTDPALNQVYITDELLASMWILKGSCANGTGNTCVP